MNQTKPIRIAVIADTPLQLLNSIRLLQNFRQLYGDVCCDLYIGHQFGDSYEMSKRIASAELFRNVFDFTPSDKTLKQEKPFRWLIENLASPKKKVAGMLNHSISEIANDYDVVAMSWYTRFATAFASWCTPCQVVFYDDGIGSYLGFHRLLTPFSGRFGSIKRAIRSATGTRWQDIKPQSLFLAEPQFCGDSPEEEVQIERLTPFEQLEQNALSCFSSTLESTRCYQDKRLVYLAAPGEDASEMQLKQTELVEGVLEKYADDVIMRNHPREKRPNLPVLQKDESNALWELICANTITDNHILLSFFSTAQFAPKLFFGKEPALIFCYKLLDEKSRDQDKDRLVEKLKGLYTKENRIFTPSSIQELNSVIISLLDNNSI